MGAFKAGPGLNTVSWSSRHLVAVCGSISIAKEAENSSSTSTVLNGVLYHICNTWWLTFENRMPAHARQAAKVQRKKLSARQTLSAACRTECERVTFVTIKIRRNFAISNETIYRLMGILCISRANITKTGTNYRSDIHFCAPARTQQMSSEYGPFDCVAVVVGSHRIHDACPWSCGSCGV